MRVQVSRISVEQLFINNWCNLLFQEHLSEDREDPGIVRLRTASAPPDQLRRPPAISLGRGSPVGLEQSGFLLT